MANKFRTIKITSSLTGKFELIWTNAPDYLIKAQLMYIIVCEEECKEIPENPYSMIEEFGYIINPFGNQDDFDEEDLKEMVIDAEFDYYLL